MTAVSPPHPMRATVAELRANRYTVKLGTKEYELRLYRQEARSWVPVQGEGWREVAENVETVFTTLASEYQLVPEQVKEAELIFEPQQTSVRVTSASILKHGATTRESLVLFPGLQTSVDRAILGRLRATVGPGPEAPRPLTRSEQFAQASLAPAPQDTGTPTPPTNREPTAQLTAPNPPPQPTNVARSATPPAAPNPPPQPTNVARSATPPAAPNPPAQPTNVERSATPPAAPNSPPQPTNVERPATPPAAPQGNPDEEALNLSVSSTTSSNATATPPSQPIPTEEAATGREGESLKAQLEAVLGEQETLLNAIRQHLLSLKERKERQHASLQEEAMRIQAFLSELSGMETQWVPDLDALQQQLRDEVSKLEQSIEALRRRLSDMPGDPLEDDLLLESLRNQAQFYAYCLAQLEEKRPIAEIKRELEETLTRVQQALEQSMLAEREISETS